MRIMKINTLNCKKNNNFERKDIKITSNLNGNHKNNVNFTGLNSKKISDMLEIGRLKFIKTNKVKKTINEFQLKYKLQQKIITSFENLAETVFPLETNSLTIEKKFRTKNEYHKKIYDKESKKLIRQIKYMLNEDDTICVRSGEMKDFNKLTGELENIYHISSPITNNVFISKTNAQNNKEFFTVIYKTPREGTDNSGKITLKGNKDFLLTNAYEYDGDAINNPSKSLIYDINSQKPILYEEYFWSSKNTLLGKVIWDFIPKSDIVRIQTKHKISKVIDGHYDSNEFITLRDYNLRRGKLLAGIEGPPL